MGKYVHIENNCLWYELLGTCYLPSLKLLEEKAAHIVWGLRHLWYLKQYHKVRYYNLLKSGKLNSFLANIDR